MFHKPFFFHGFNGRSRGRSNLRLMPALAGSGEGYSPSAACWSWRPDTARACVLFSWFLFGRFFAQRVGGFLFARRGGDKLYAARGRFALALANVIEEPLQVVTGFAREVVARLADFSQDFVHGSRFQQIERGANRRTRPARLRAEAFNLPTDGNVMNVRAIPRQQDR